MHDVGGSRIYDRTEDTSKKDNPSISEPNKQGKVHVHFNNNYIISNDHFPHIIFLLRFWPNSIQIGKFSELTVHVEQAYQVFYS